MAAYLDVSVVTNSFAITRLPIKEYYQYDVFRPDLPIATKRQRAIHLLQTSVAPGIFHPRGVYDGKSLLYVSHQLHLPGGGSGSSFPIRLGNDPNAPVGSPGVVEVCLSKTASDVIRPSDLNRLIQHGQTIDSKTATATNLLQLLIRQSSNQNNPTNNGRAYFSDMGKRSLPGTGIELWRGFYQSVRPVIGRMLVTIDTSMAAVYESGRLLDVAASVLNIRNSRDLGSGLSDRDFHKLQVHFKNRLIKTRTTGDRTKTIHALERGPIGRHSFRKDDKTITVAEHYYQAYAIRLSHPDSFGVRLSGKNAPFPVIVPAELCTVLPGQLYKKRLPTSTTADVVDFATMPPRARLQTIKGGTAAGVQSPIQGYQTSEFIVDAGMVIDPNPIKVRAKLLTPPTMRFGTQTIMPNNGSWNVVNQKFSVAKDMKVWGVLNLDPLRIRQDVEHKTVSEIIRCCRLLGMVVEPPVAVDRGEGHAVDKLLETMSQRMPRYPDVIIVLLPKVADDIRIRVKFWGDVKRGVRTSCLREDKLQRANPAYFNNVAIKLNARLGGHYALPSYAPPQSDVLAGLGSSPFMMFGLDASHPGPGVLKPTITSVVWSWDTAAASYTAYSDVQTPRVEVIQELRGMVREAIFQFGNRNKTPPKRLIFFRDGVSEGELETIKTEEINAIRAACQDVWKRMKITLPLPTITFIVVVKRHHTLFFPNSNEVDDGKGNCRAGLVVDELRSPLGRDFYLQAHGGLKGTSKAGHYRILLDENFHEDVSTIQRLSFELCHIYAKATRSISIPAPVYYADLVCARGKFHFDPDDTNLDFDSSTNASGSEQFDLAKWKAAYQPLNGTANFDKMMYFL